MQSLETLTIILKTNLMKKIGLTLLLLFSSLFNYAQTHPNDIEDKCIAGKVKSVARTSYQTTLKDGKIEKTNIVLPPGSLYTNYDRHGNISYKKHCDRRTGQILSEEVFTYDKSGNLKTSTATSWVGEFIKNYKYNNVTKTREIIDNINYRLITIFDSAGNIIDEKYFDDKKSLIRSVNYSYDKKKRLIEVNTNEPNESFYVTKLLLEYDDKLKIMNFHTEFSNKELKKEKYIYSKFDNNGNWIERIMYDTYDQPLLTEIRLIEYYKNTK